MRLSATPFLTAQWRHLVVLNFEIDPVVLRPYIPRGTELDLWHDTALVSLVGFQFVDTRVCGLAIPLHRNFAEVNLRFYVRRRTDDGWRRGVVFIRELAPRWAISWTARLLFGENYRTVPIRHAVQIPNGDPRALSPVNYHWRYRGRECGVHLTATGTGSVAAEGSLEEFVIEHYWGYSGGADRRTIEYRVDHPRWPLWPAASARFEGDVERLYGPQFVEALSAPPSSAFYADGSAVSVFRGLRIA